MNKKKDKVRNIFDSISNRYDLLNHLLSLGIDKRWRKKALKLTTMNSSSRLLDIACGTGDFANTAKKMGVENIIGADLSHNMLENFNKKFQWSKGNIVQLSAEELPLKDNSFTNITIAFGVRNFYDIPKALSALRKILMEKGKLTILEFRLPSNTIIKNLYLLYFQKILPTIGGLISGDKAAYSYLPSSVDEFDKNVNLKKVLEKIGYKKITVKTLTFGIVQIVIAEK